MAERNPYLKGKKILAVDDEEDILNTLVEALEEAHVDRAADYQTALKLIEREQLRPGHPGHHGGIRSQAVEKTVEKSIPTVMLTAHALSAETLLASIRKGAIFYLPKEKLAEIDTDPEPTARIHGIWPTTWNLLFDKLGDFFDEKFGPDWKKRTRSSGPSSAAPITSAKACRPGCRTTRRCFQKASDKFESIVFTGYPGRQRERDPWLSSRRTEDKNSVPINDRAILQG